MRSAPLLRDTVALCGVLLGDLEAGEGFAAIRDRLRDGAIRLLDHVALALGRFEQLAAVERADAELHCLRVHLTVAREVGVLDEQAFLDHAAQMDRVGRQLGGWLKQLSGERRRA